MVRPDSYQRCGKRDKKGVVILETFIDDGFALLIPQLFFWFFPPGPEGSLDDLIFWYAVSYDSCLAVRSSTGRPQGQTEVLVARRWRVPSKKTE
jgi:hypothetical protein